ncbi:hypothetical protein AWB71_00922 [Caballeronia peredens]|nr:hypothetical protein AWB71_00922 [Caballeronia peredens]
MARAHQPIIATRANGMPNVAVKSERAEAISARINRLTRSRVDAYSFTVAETTATRIGVRNSSLADNRRSAVFLRPHTMRLQWSGLGGGALAHAGIQRRRYANPALCSATPIGVGGRVLTPVSGGRIMRQSLHAHTGHVSPAILEFIVRDAIKRAALAPSHAAALDIAGEALLAVAQILSREVSHG